MGKVTYRTNIQELVYQYARSIKRAIGRLEGISHLKLHEVARFYDVSFRINNAHEVVVTIAYADIGKVQLNSPPNGGIWLKTVALGDTVVFLNFSPNVKSTVLMRTTIYDADTITKILAKLEEIRYWPVRKSQ